MNLVQTNLMDKPIFQSFFMGGFECSSHRLPSGRRLDVIAATQHDRFAAGDYHRLQAQGLRTARDGLRWHLIETRPRQYDFSSAYGMLRAARETGMQIIWDLCHYGWPDDIDIFTPEFVRRFARFARACAQVLVNESKIPPLIVPINEISFWAWGGGEEGFMNPFARERGNELKKQLVRAAIAGIEAIWSVDPTLRIISVEPIINVLADPQRPEDQAAAEAHHQAQYHAWDMLAGRRYPELGGTEKYLDIIGVNYYVHNQWILNGSPILDRSHPRYRPFREMLGEVYGRYGRPMFIAETGIEDQLRPEWFRYVSSEVIAARQSGLPLYGLCLYPIVNHPGWADDRHCHNGLWDYPNEAGEREIYQPLAQELHRQMKLVKALSRPEKMSVKNNPDFNFSIFLC